MIEKPTSYCAAVSKLEPDNDHRVYHDTAYGFPIQDDNELFGRLLLEINQAGLSWTTILKKKDTIRKAYAHFDIRQVAHFDHKDRERLLQDPGIIRNRLKIEAAIFNAQKILQLQSTFFSFKGWLDHHHPMDKDQWVKLFKKTFKFTGGEITNEFLLSTGYLPGAHEEHCPIFQKVVQQGPKWLSKS